MLKKIVTFNLRQGRGFLHFPPLSHFSILTANTWHKLNLMIKILLIYAIKWRQKKLLNKSCHQSILSVSLARKLDGLVSGT